MKIQCSCGAKYAFDVTPELAQQPVRFVCQVCGADSSAFINQLIRQELGLDTAEVAKAASAIAPAIEVAPPPGNATAPEPASTEGETTSPTPPSPPRVRLHRGGEKATEAAPAQVDQRFCPKHPGQRTVEICVVCGKPICPKCMELFGYLCSAACKGKAGLKGIAVPVFAGQKVLVERRRWRKIGLAFTGACLLTAAFVGVWIWYAWFGTVPHPTYAVRFTDPAYAGGSRLCGTNQIVFLHGGTLARHDLKAKKEIWSCQLIDRKKIEQEVDEEIKEAADRRLKSEYAPSPYSRPPSRESQLKWALASAMQALDLRVKGQNVWVSSPGKLVRYDWDTGKQVQEISLTNRFGGLLPRGDELLMLERRTNKHVITHINLATGETRDEEIAILTQRTNKLTAKAGGALKRGSSSKEMAGLPVGPPSGQDADKPLDPAKVKEQASHLSLPERIALPAVLAINRNQEKALAELNDDPRKPGKSPVERWPDEVFTLIPAKAGFVQFSSRMIEERMVERTAMKAPPKKSKLDSAPTVANTAEIANEILNDMQRERGGATVTEDESRYRVAIRAPNSKDIPDWMGDVIGPPALFPLQTVNVLTAGKTVTVLDKQNQKLWAGTISFPVESGGALDEEEAPYGLGPCVERAGRLFICDEGTLSAFDLKTGNAQWRLPSVGLAGLFFDDAGMLYANTTTAGHDTLKYSRQIDISTKTSASVMKVDPQTGKTLWTSQIIGMISYLRGPYIYTVQSHAPPIEEEEVVDSVLTLAQGQPHVRILRINPKNGKEMWEHFQERGPLDVQFDKNSIQLVFKREVQVLKYISF